MALQSKRRCRSHRAVDLPKVGTGRRIKSGGDEDMGRDKPDADV
jgi:hypothetical protein